ncbi:MAG: hypothetical protein NT087_08335 [Deltaproteobacteria bacterium]|nr:hypothetical protein [Deltaproteobacteria bacterium]
MSASTLETAPMHNEFAIAKVKVKAKHQCHAVFGGPEHNTDVGHEVSKAGLGVILCAGAIIGLSGFFFMVGGLIKSGGITSFVKGWLTAFTGI